MQDIKDILNFAKRVTIPLFALKRESKTNKVEAFGTGFILNYDRKLYLITAEHLIHDNLDVDSEELLNKFSTSLYIGIDTKVCEDGKTIIREVTNYYNTLEFTKLDSDDESLIHSLYDVIVAPISDYAISYDYVDLKVFFLFIIKLYHSLILCMGSLITIVTTL